MSKILSRPHATAKKKADVRSSIRCFFGFHKPNDEWILKFSSQVHYCNCKRCGRYMPENTRFTFTEAEFYKQY